MQVTLYLDPLLRVWPVVYGGGETAWTHPRLIEARITRLEWLLENGDRKAAQKGAIKLLAELGEAQSAGYQGVWQSTPIEEIKSLCDQISDLYVRAEPVRTTSWERVIKDEGYPYR